MRMRRMLAGAAVAVAMAFPVMAQDTGQYREPLTQIATEAAGGSCPAALMAQSLLDACNGQIQGMAAALAALGAIETMTFVSPQDTPGGRVETWRVTYSGGQALTWVIGELKDGKFSTVGVTG